MAQVRIKQVQGLGGTLSTIGAVVDDLTNIVTIRQIDENPQSSSNTNIFLSSQVRKSTICTINVNGIDSTESFSFEKDGTIYLNDGSVEIPAGAILVFDSVEAGFELSLTDEITLVYESGIIDDLPTDLANGIFEGTQYDVQGVSYSGGIGGTSGTSGTSGLTGIKGATGAQGAIGPKGVTGVQGAQGAHGIKGSTGIKGASGTSGTSGTSGINGATGAQGATGVSGTSGTSGSQGPAGIKGAKGDPGDPSGTSGTSGINGTSGTSGISGQIEGTVTGTLIPDTDIAYDLGSATKRFKDLYLSGNTLYMGGQPLSIVNGQLTLNGNPVSGTPDTWFSNYTNTIPSFQSSNTISNNLFPQNTKWSTITEGHTGSISNSDGFIWYDVNLVISRNQQRLAIAYIKTDFNASPVYSMYIDTFELDSNSNWNKMGSVPVSNGLKSYLGMSIDYMSFSLNANTLVISQPFQTLDPNMGTSGNGGGFAEVFDWNGTMWIKRGSTIEEYPTVIDSRFGSFTKISNDGNSILFSGRNTSTNIKDGYVCRYEWDGTDWTKIGNNIVGAPGNLEYRVDASGDLSKIIIGNAGYEISDYFPTPVLGELKIYLYNSLSSTWSLQQTITQDISMIDYGYTSPKISDDGNIITINENYPYQSTQYQSGDFISRTKVFNYSSTWNYMGSIEHNSRSSVHGISNGGQYIICRIYEIPDLSGNFVYTNYRNLDVIFEYDTNTASWNNLLSDSYINLSNNIPLEPNVSSRLNYKFEKLDTSNIYTLGGFHNDINIINIFDISTYNVTPSTVNYYALDLTNDSNYLSNTLKFYFNDQTLYTILQTCHIYYDVNNYIKGKVISNQNNIVEIEILEKIGSGVYPNYSITLG